MAVAGFVVHSVVAYAANGISSSSNDLSNQPYAKDINGIDFGPGRVLPSLTLKNGYNDNLLTQNSNTIATFFNIITPSLGYVLQDNKRKLLLDYTLSAGFFEGSHKDDYDDHKLSTTFDYHPTNRLFTSLNANYKQTHDGRGSGRADSGTGAVSPSLDEWHQWDVNGKVAYGTESSKGRIELESGYVDKKYDTNRLFTYTRDRAETFATGRFYYRMLPKTFLVTEIRARDYSYDTTAVGTNSLDSMDMTYLAGVTWLATYKTSGYVKLGYITKDFDSALRKDGSGFTWEMGVDWKPKFNSTVHLETSETLDETNGTGDFIDITNYKLIWTHFWRAKIKTDLQFLYQNLKYDPVTREDNLYSAGISAGYYFKRWMSVDLGYRREKLDSNVPVFNYDENIIELTAYFTF